MISVTSDLETYSAIYKRGFAEVTVNIDYINQNGLGDSTITISIQEGEYYFEIYLGQNYVAGSHLTINYQFTNLTLDKIDKLKKEINNGNLEYVKLLSRIVGVNLHALLNKIKDNPDGLDAWKPLNPGDNSYKISGNLDDKIYYAYRY